MMQVHVPLIYSRYLTITIITLGHVDIYLFVNISFRHLYNMRRSCLVSSCALQLVVNDFGWFMAGNKSSQSPYRLHTDRTHSGKYIIFRPTAQQRTQNIINRARIPRSYTRGDPILKILILLHNFNSLQIKGFTIFIV